jgi:molybdopterin-guanine dinucleotide biosynthesis protein A
LTAIVLAGGARDEVTAHDPSAPNKAFVSIGGRTLVERVVDALRTSPHIRRVIAVAPAEAFGHPALAGADEVRPSGVRMRESLHAGVAELAPDEPVLVTASDLPILTTAAIEDFLARAASADADIAYACVERGAHLARFPDVPHTWAHLRDGSFCGGGVVTMRPRALETLDRFLGRLGAARKNPLRLAQIFGLDMLARYALRRLSISDAERRASALLGVRVRAAVCAYPEIAVNVDRASDVALAERLVAAGVSATA